MTLPLVLFLFAVVAPLFFSKTNAAPAWLGIQALALAWGAYDTHAHHGGDSTHAIVSMFELIMVRACFVPLYLSKAVERRREPAADLMPSNLFAWALAMTLLVLAFEFVESAPGTRDTFAVGIVTATLVSALLMLATTQSAMAQLIAVLFIENGIAMFESTFREPWPLVVHGMLVTIYALTAVVGAWLLPREQADASDAAEGIEGGEVAGSREVL